MINALFGLSANCYEGANGVRLHIVGANSQAYFVVLEGVPNIYAVSQEDVDSRIKANKIPCLQG